jgi:hypothetical protein
VRKLNVLEQIGPWNAPRAESTSMAVLVVEGLNASYRLQEIASGGVWCQSLEKYPLAAQCRYDVRGGGVVK